MKILYGILVFIVLYFGFSYARFIYILSRANLPPIEQKDHTAGMGQKIKYIAAGDSTAVGVGASETKNTYTSQIMEYLAESKSVEYRNVAAIGAQTDDMIENQLESIISFDPDVVTISIGANDITHWIPASKIVENYAIIIDRLIQETKAKIYITNVPRLDKAYLLPWPFRQYFDSQAKKANRALLELEKERVEFIDIHSVDSINSADQFHPSDEGYKLWSQAFLSKIKVVF